MRAVVRPNQNSWHSVVNARQCEVRGLYNLTCLPLYWDDVSQADGSYDVCADLVGSIDLTTATATSPV